MHTGKLYVSVYSSIYYDACLFVCLFVVGDYIFGILSSNTSEMWLSTSEDFQSLSKIVCLGCIDQVRIVCLECV